MIEGENAAGKRPESSATSDPDLVVPDPDSDSAHNQVGMDVAARFPMRCIASMPSPQHFSCRSDVATSRRRSGDGGLKLRGANVWCVRIRRHRHLDISLDRTVFRRSKLRAASIGVGSGKELESAMQFQISG
jgi:hypothetical protein